MPEPTPMKGFASLGIPPNWMNCSSSPISFLAPSGNPAVFLSEFPSQTTFHGSGMSSNTVHRWLERAGERCRRFNDRHFGGNHSQVLCQREKNYLSYNQASCTRPDTMTVRCPYLPDASTHGPSHLATEPPAGPPTSPDRSGLSFAKFSFEVLHVAWT